MLTLLTATGIGLGVFATLIPDSKNKICNHTKLNSLKGKGLQISEHVRLSQKMSNEHVNVIFPSGSGKSFRYIIPNVNKLKNCSMVVTDPSGEVEEFTHRKDIKKIIFNPFRVQESVGFNPLANCKNSFEVKQIIETLMENSVLSINGVGAGEKMNWIQMSLPLIKAYSLYNFYTNKYSFDVMIENLLQKPLLSKNKDDIYHEIMNSNIAEVKVELNSFLQIAPAQQTLACIRNTLTSALQLFLDSSVKRLCRKPTIDFTSLRREETILYIQIPERYSKYYSPVTATFVQQLMNRLLDNKKGLNVYMLFDEFANIGKITDINAYLSTCRKHNISISACLQNLVQLKRVYGEIEAEELRNLFKTTVICGGLRDDNEYFSKLIGETEVKKGNTIVRKPLFSPEKIRQLPDNEVIILCKNKKPVKDVMVKTF